MGLGARIALIGFYCRCLGSRMFPHLDDAGTLQLHESELGLFMNVHEMLGLLVAEAPKVPAAGWGQILGLYDEAIC